MIKNIFRKIKVSSATLAALILLLLTVFLNVAGWALTH